MDKLSRKAIYADVWAARNMIAKQLDESIDEIRSMYFSEDGMIEDPNYRNDIMNKLVKLQNMTLKLNKQVKTLIKI